MTKVREITCPQCDRVWPTISEQGIVVELYDKCYQCLIDQVVKARDERAGAADYLVQNCSTCGGLPPKVTTCVPCGGRGWETVDKGQEALPVAATYPH